MSYHLLNYKLSSFNPNQLQRTLSLESSSTREIGFVGISRDYAPEGLLADLTFTKASATAKTRTISYTRNLPHSVRHSAQDQVRLAP